MFLWDGWAGPTTKQIGQGRIERGCRVGSKGRGEPDARYLITEKKAQGSFTVGKRRKWQRRIILRMKTTGYSGCLLTNTVKSRPLHASKPPSGLSLIACADGNPLGVILPLRTLKSGCKLANTATLKDSHFFKSRSIAVAQPGVARQRRFVSDLRCR